MDLRGSSSSSIFIIASALLLAFLLSCSTFIHSEVHDDLLDPAGNITIQWDIIGFTRDGYGAKVTIQNFQLYRPVQTPGWSLGWTWSGNEVIWSMMGGQTTERGNCSRFIGNIPQCCKKDPTVVDLSPGTPHNQKIPNCCKGGVMSSWSLDPVNAVSSFQLKVRAPGTTNETIKVPKGFTLEAPGSDYTCGTARLVKPDKSGARPALMTWKVVCTYTKLLSQRNPTCCVAFSSFQDDGMASCRKCACDCPDNNTQSGNCLDKNTPNLGSVISDLHGRSNKPILQCTDHMCPVRIHWHIMENQKEYWRAKITITNLNYNMVYSQWNLVVQQPNFDNHAWVNRFYYMPITLHGSRNAAAVLSGVPYTSEFIMEAGPFGNVHSEVFFYKNSDLTFDKDLAFPRSVYFNGDYCLLPQFQNNSSTSREWNPESQLAVLMALSFLVVLVLYCKMK